MLAKYISESTIDTSLPRVLTLADGSIATGDVSSHVAELKILGFLPVVDVPFDGEIPEGWHLVERYTTDGDTISRGYALEEDEDVDPTPPARSLSKRKLYRALLQAGIWEQVKAYMMQNNVWEDWEYATTLDEDDPLIIAAIQALQTDMQIPAETIEQLLAASVAS